MVAGQGFSDFAGLCHRDDAGATDRPVYLDPGFCKNFQDFSGPERTPGRVIGRRFTVKSTCRRNNIFTALRQLRNGICVESQALGLSEFGGAGEPKKTSSESTPHFTDSPVAAPKSSH